VVAFETAYWAAMTASEAAAWSSKAKLS